MTAYSFQGLLVDVKGYNWHMSAPVDTTLTSAGLDGSTTQISVGTVVMDGGAGLIDVAQADVKTYLGVMNETRPLSSSTDQRSATYTWAGVVRVKTTAANIAIGNHFKCAANGAVVAITETTLTDHHNIAFGRALEAVTDGAATIIMGYINMAH